MGILSLSAVMAAGSKSKGPKTPQVRVTQKTIDRLEVSPRNAAISVCGRANYRGIIQVVLGKKTYQLTKDDAGLCWVGGQTKEQREDFVALFNTLAEKPGEYQGEVTFIEAE